MNESEAGRLPDAANILYNSMNRLLAANEAHTPDTAVNRNQYTI